MAQANDPPEKERNGKGPEVLESRIAGRQINLVFRRLNPEQKREFWKLLGREVGKGYDEETAVRHIFREMGIEDLSEFRKK